MFLRLKYTGIPSADPFHDDFENDRIGNYAELLQGTDPLASFELDSNRLPDDREQYYFGHTGNRAFALAARGDGLTNHQTGNPGELLPLPLIVAVKQPDGSPWKGAPGSFRVSAGGGQIQNPENAAQSQSLELRTDEKGQAAVYFCLAGTVSSSSQINASAGGMGHRSTVVFNETSDDGSGTFGSAEAATNFRAILKRDASMDFSRENDPLDNGDIKFTIQQRDGTWKTVTTVPAGTTSVHVAAPCRGAVGNR